MKVAGSWVRPRGLLLFLLPSMLSADVSVRDDIIDPVPEAFSRPFLH
jgi:hypothetical protein